MENKTGEHKPSFKDNFKSKIRNNFRNRKQIYDFTSKMLIYSFAILTILILFTLIGFIIYKSTYFLKHYDKGFWGFITGGVWNANTQQFGIWRIIISTFFVLLISLSIAIPLTIFSSLYICEYLTPRWKHRVINIVQLLAGVPSVVFGLFALTILGPLFMKLGAPSSSNLIVTSITLAFMGLPIMISLSLNAIDTVPEAYRLSSLALGLSHTHTTFRIVLRAAWPKIVAAIMMGIARIVGETMAVMMISGNSPIGLKLNDGLLSFLFSAISTLSSTIGLEMLENSGALHESALYTIGLVLFIVIFVINLLILWIQASRARKHHRVKHRKMNLEQSKFRKKRINEIFYEKISSQRKFKKIGDGIGLFFLISSTVIVVSFTLLVIGTIIWKGLFHMVPSDLISTSTYNDGSGILATFLVTLLLVICSIIIAIPLSLFVAIYLNEYAQPTNFLTKGLRFTIDLLASTPSILYGTFGLAFFIGVLGIPLSILSAGLTLTIVILPIMIRSIEDSLSGVPQDLRNSSLALGSSKIETIFKVVLPNALPGIITAIILAVARVIGESAPVYLTLGTAVRLPGAGFLSPGASMSTEILLLSKEGASARALQIMYELAFAIMIMILCINALARVLAKRLSPTYSHVPFKDKWKMRYLAVKNFEYKDYYNNKKQLLKKQISKLKFKNKKHRDQQNDNDKKESADNG